MPHSSHSPSIIQQSTTCFTVGYFWCSKTTPVYTYFAEAPKNKCLLLFCRWKKIFYFFFFLSPSLWHLKKLTPGSESQHVTQMWCAVEMPYSFKLFCCSLTIHIQTGDVLSSVREHVEKFILSCTDHHFHSPPSLPPLSVSHQCSDQAWSPAGFPSESSAKLKPCCQGPNPHSHSFIITTTPTPLFCFYLLLLCLKPIKIFPG